MISLLLNILGEGIKKIFKKNLVLFGEVSVPE
jgi:hypothetical protein